MDPTLFDPDDGTAPAVPAPPPSSPRPGSVPRPPTATGARDRLHTSPPRRTVLRMRLSQSELTDITAAAARLHLTPSGYAAEAATTAARDETGLYLDVLRAALIDLVDAREHLRRLTDTATASHPSHLPSAVEVAAERAVAAVEDAASDLVRSLRHHQRRQPPQRTRRGHGRAGSAGDELQPPVPL